MRLRLRSGFVAILLSVTAVRGYGQFSGPAIRNTVPQRGDVVTTDAALLRPEHRSIYLTPGDLVNVRIYGSIDYNPTVRVSLENTLQLPLIGSVLVKRLTVEQAELLIAAKLKSSGMYVDPQVNLQVMESTHGVITVMGESHAVIPASTEHRLLEVLSAAGGLPPNASHTITIERPGVERPIVVDLGNDPMRSREVNLPLYPGDTVIVSRVGVVYMLGEFKTAGVIPIQQNSPLTLLQATTAAGGTLYAGRFEDLRIIRTVDGKRSLVHADIKRIMLGKDPDPVLQADDIVFLPTNTLKAALTSGGLNLLVSVANLAVISARY